MNNKKKAFYCKCLLTGLSGRFRYDEEKDILTLIKVNLSETYLAVGKLIDEVDNFLCCNCKNLKEIELYSQLKRIGVGAFFNCRNLEKITLIYENGNKKNFYDLSSFLAEFKGTVEAGAFENCFDSNNLISNSMDYEGGASVHLQFIEALSPLPFYKNEDNTVLLKILSDSDDGQTHISLLNYDMLFYDLKYFDSDNYIENRDNQEKYYYRPYFYEFFVEESKEIFSKYVNDNLGEWMVGKIIDSEESNLNDYIIKGYVLFSASPIKYEKMQLIIQDRKASASICDKIKKLYELQHANVINISNRSVLEPIINSVIDKKTPSYAKIYNVGQAACNYLYFEDKKIMFDVGYRYTKEKPINKIIANNHHIFFHCKPDLIILSHWDLDHILGVAYSKQNLFNVKWIAPSMQNLSNDQYTISAARLAKYLSWRGKLYTIDDELNGDKVFLSPSLQIWKGMGKSNTKKLIKKGKIVEINGIEIKGLNKANNIGLILKIVSKSYDMILPGDCEYQMMPPLIYGHYVRYDNIVIPHHASNMPLKRSRKHAKHNGIRDNAFISAGYNKYIPTHPWDEHIKFLKRLKYNVYTTSDCNKPYIKINLQTNEIT